MATASPLRKEPQEQRQAGAHLCLSVGELAFTAGCGRCTHPGHGCTWGVRLDVPEVGNSAHRAWVAETRLAAGTEGEFLPGRHPQGRSTWAQKRVRSQRPWHWAHSRAMIPASGWPSESNGDLSLNLEEDGAVQRVGRLRFIGKRNSTFPETSFRIMARAPCKRGPGRGGVYASAEASTRQ